MKYTEKETGDQVDAFQVMDSDIESKDVPAWFRDALSYKDMNVPTGYLFLNTPGRSFMVKWGDWVIKRDDSGEFDTETDDVFMSMYEKVAAKKKSK